MGKMDSILLKSKFRGTVLAALMGDCLGSAYEGEELFTAGMKLVFQRSLDKLEGPYFKAPVMQFTDDSAMTYAVAESLIEQNGFDQKDMARKFVKSYFKEPNRGYGAGVTTVFNKLRNNKFDDVLGPAREQFNGQGSLGNGGAMRVSPVALFCHKDYEAMVETARKQSHITHTHKTGVDGAILQAIAVQQSLLLDPKDKLDVCKFADDLIDKMDKIEVDEEGLGLVDPSPYKTQLKLVKELINEDGDGPHEEKVVQLLGNDVAALHSVPTAIYCFLRAQKPIKDVQTENPLRRTVQYAISSDSHHEMNPKYCEGIEWSQKDIYKLVSWYREFPCLWKTDNTAYTNNVERHCAYRSIHEAMNMRNVTFTDVMMKIREIRRSYVNELKKALKARADGFTYRPKPTWFNVMHAFLFPYLDYNESVELDSAADFSVDDTRRRRHCSNREEQSSYSTSEDHCYPLAVFLQQNRQKPFSMQTSGDSVLSLSARSSSTCTIVCEKRSDYTCTSVKSFTDRGMQWKSSDSEKRTSPASRAAYSVKKETRDLAISVEYDEHDIFAKTIAAYLRSMDVETALKARIQIDKVITDHRLHKPETISLGGDTDTIGSMAGAIAGAYYGEDMIRQEVLKHCEKSDEFRNIADKLFDLASVE